MKAVVIGATGATGRELIKMLEESDEITKINALVRKRNLEAHPKLNQIEINFEKLEEFANEINGDFAFSCLGTTLKAAGSKAAQFRIDHDYQLKFAEVCSQNKIPLFVLISALGAKPDAMFFYSKMKGKLEEKIEKLSFKKLLIFQPGLLSRPGSKRTGERLAEKILNILNSIGLMKSYKPLNVSILAQSMLFNAFSKENGIHRIRGREIKQFLNQ